MTVNDYLASRDADWMGAPLQLARPLGRQDPHAAGQRNEARRVPRDITYGTNNEFGFDYLRDNMEYDTANRRQRGLYYAIVDEVIDSY